MKPENLFPFKIPIKVLKVFGLWQKKTSSSLYFFYGVVMHVIFIDIYTLLQFYYFFTFMTFEDFAFLMTLLPTYAALVVKSINFMYYVDDIVMLLETIQEILEEESFTETLQKQLYRVHLVYIWFSGTAIATCILAIGIPFVYHELPYRMWFPYDYNKSQVLFWLSVSYQLFDSTCYAAVDIVLDTLPAIFMCYILGMLEELCSRLENLKGQSNVVGGSKEFIKIDNKKELLHLIQLQLKIHDLSRKVEKYFSFVIVAQGSMSTLILCTTSFALTIVSSIFFVLSICNTFKETVMKIIDVFYIFDLLTF